MCLPFSCCHRGDHDTKESEVESQPYYHPSPVKEAHDGHRATNDMPPVVEDNSKNGGGHTTGFSSHSDDGVVRGGETTITTEKIVAPPTTTPAPQAASRDLAVQQAPQGTYVSASRPRHNHGRGSSAASPPSEAVVTKVVLPMARRGGEDY
ncbi:hypothetical protein Zm00014a_040284 [Zea mays]|uniref:Uncharacterized protein n=1 Tax=Zea mays TaxID=4577 RepID=A0A3L6D8H2_MAIZE|nr:hypothetical protein Zm00014a_040284 [Zea mays]